MSCWKSDRQGRNDWKAIAWEVSPHGGFPERTTQKKKIDDDNNMTKALLNMIYCLMWSFILLPWRASHDDDELPFVLNATDEDDVNAFSLLT